ncbi:hypothetical protein Nepgr_032430 [Nepenthes gracilis]|uniref:Uncharacterized protein n=1 Tax=Nepenthes gracilis TaxID=150966 RepID=A0AAD3TKU4_NEPGR|nr:hypothetical protein Nepgr_032430 [Nepenthes gracilis]
MNSQLDELYGSLQGFNLSDQRRSILSSQNLFDALKLEDLISNNNFGNPYLLRSNLNYCGMFASIGDKIEGNHHDDYDLSDGILNYISQVLMEEDVEEKIWIYQEAPALEATEKSLYEAIGEKYPPSQNHNLKIFNKNATKDCVSYQNSSSSSINFVGKSWIGYLSEYKSRNISGFPRSSNSNPSIQISCSSSNSPERVVDHSPSDSLASVISSSSTSVRMAEGLVDSPVISFRISEIFNDTKSLLQFNKGVEQAFNFHPNRSLYLTDRARDVAIKLENRHNYEYSTEVLMGKKHRQPEDSRFEEGRGSKQSAVFNEAVLRSEEFDMVLLDTLKDDLNRTVLIGQSKKSSSEKGRDKKVGKKILVDLPSLLSLCAQAVAANDQRSANELLKKIRQHSSPLGDGNQRMAHYFANGLEARLAGVGTPIYTFIIYGPTPAADMLRAYHLFLTACPYEKISSFFATRTIMNVAEKSTKVHIIDFGIVYGFQWPSLIQRLSLRSGGPPKLRITGIDSPQPGFRPAKRVEETGCRLANYAKSFDVPFEFNAIAKKWETISVEDLKIDSDEVLIVNCKFRLKYLHDETVIARSPRNRVLNLIRKINPEAFIIGVVNGAYNAPFFLTRFREAMFHFSTLFDMLEANVPREIKERLLLEQEIFGRQAMNAIACEGFERIERPETYKQWHVRNERAGFRQLPLNREIVDTAKDWVRSFYHQDFVISEDDQWLLQGWKGRIVSINGVYCISYIDHKEDQHEFRILMIFLKVGPGSPTVGSRYPDVGSTFGSSVMIRFAHLAHQSNGSSPTVAFPCSTVEASASVAQFTLSRASIAGQPALAPDQSIVPSWSTMPSGISDSQSVHCDEGVAILRSLIDKAMLMVLESQRLASSIGDVESLWEKLARSLVVIEQLGLESTF